MWKSDGEVWSKNLVAIQKWNKQKRICDGGFDLHLPQEPTCLHIPRYVYRESKNNKS